MKKNIVLVGMMGSGKTTVANLLKERLRGFELVDIDSIITALEGRSINEIFEKDSELYFREIEKNIIKEFSSMFNQIISTGGGACKDKTNLFNLKKNSIIFYLSASAEELYNRVKDDSSRPLLQTDNPKSVMENLLKERENNYKLADYEIETANKSFDTIVEEIIEKYKKYE